MNSNGTKFIVRKTSNYTCIANQALKDERLSLKAVGLLSKILTFSDDWEYSINGLKALCKQDGITSVRSALKELKDCGYVKIIKLMPSQTKSGRIEYIYEIYELPQQDNENQDKEIQVIEKQDIENLHLENLYLNKVNNKEVPTDKVSFNKLTFNSNTEKCEQKTIEKFIEMANNTKNQKESKKTANTGLKQRFVKPTPQQVEEYAQSIGKRIDGEYFCNYYESKGWVVGKSPMKNWKAAVNTWVRNNQTKTVKHDYDYYSRKFAEEEEGLVL